jgi:hypothetical protein
MRLSPARLWNALAARPVPAGVNAALAWTALGLSAAAVFVVPLPVPPLAKFLVVLGFACFAPGAALLAHVHLGNAVASWAMSLVLSLSLFGIGAAVMVWSANWHPYPALAGYASACVLAAGAAFVPWIAGRAGLPDEPRAGPVAGQRHRPARVQDRQARAMTAIIPKIPQPRASETTVLPRIPAAAGPVTRRPLAFAPRMDLTRFIPRIREPVLEPATERRRTAEPAPVPGVLRFVSVVFGPAFLASTVLYWIAGLQLSSTAGVGDFGLLSVLHPYFYVAVGLCVFGFLVEVSRGARRTWLLAGHLVVLLLILHATVPLLVFEPEYAWTYKHVGVMELFKAKGGIVNIVDIYQAWPTFFATVAQLSAVSGLSTLRIAAWAPLFFDAADCLPLFAIARSLTEDRRVPWLTVFLFSCLNWVAQDYLSPQAFTYVLCLGAALVMLRWLRRVPGPAGVWPKWLGRLWNWLHAGMPEVPYVSRRAERVALASLYLVFLVVVISHQLSPYLVALSATGLVVLGLVRSWQIVPILFGICAVYLLPHYDVVDNYGLFDGFNIFSTFARSTQGVAPDAVGSAGRAFSVQVVQITSVLMWGLAGLAVLTSRERLGRIAVPATLAFAPFAVMFGQGYGGEAIYRVFLFSVPWCAYLIATLMLRIPKVPRPVAVVGATAALSAAALASVQGAHGQLVFDQFTRNEVETAQYLYTHAPPDSAILAPSSNIPLRLTANYGSLGGGGDPDDLSVALPKDRGTITADDLKAVDAMAQGYGGTPVFVMLSKSEQAYLHYFGYGPDGQLDNLNRALAGSPAWKVFYRTPDSVVYRFVGEPG